MVSLKNRIVVLQMDPLDEVDIDGDTSFDLALEAYNRGATIWTYQPDDLIFLNGRVSAFARRVTRLERIKGNHVSFDAPVLLDLHTVDVILVRQDPPFNMAYLTAAQLLERVQPGVLVLNDPQGIRDAPEKLFVTDFQDLTPPTLITLNIQAVQDFRSDHGDIVLKPLYGNGGAGVFLVRHDDGNFNTIVEQFIEHYQEPMIAQKFLKDVSAGDKRIILIDGEPVGAINRVPAPGETRSNMHVGGKAEAIDLTDRDKEICSRIGPALKSRGLVLTGIDVIGSWLTEINVTSPTGVQEVRRFGGADISALFWDWVERQ